MTKQTILGLQEIKEKAKRFKTLQEQKAQRDQEMKVLKEELEQWATANRSLFDDKNNLDVGSATLKFRVRRSIVLAKGFSFKQFVAKHTEFVKPAFQEGMLIKALENPFAKDAFKDYKFRIKEESKFDIL